MGSTPSTAFSACNGASTALLETHALGLNFSPSARGVFPAINVFANEKDNSVVFRAEVPGIPPDQLNVSIESQRLTFRGERPAAESPGSYHRRERSFGKFSRTIQLPEGLDPDQVSADCRDGILTVRIMPSEAARPRKIKVQAQ